MNKIWQLQLDMQVGSLGLVLLFLVLYCRIGIAQDQPAHLDTLGSFVPTYEIGNNAGPEIPVIESLNYMGFQKGTPYCAATGSWCLEITGAKRPKIRTALATEFIKSEKVVLAERVLHKKDTAKVGWGIVWRRGNGYHGHFGFVDSTWTGRCGWSVEANTTKNGREGIFRKHRCIKPSAYFSIVAFIPTDPDERVRPKDKSKKCSELEELYPPLYMELYPYMRRFYRTPNGPFFQFWD